MFIAFSPLGYLRKTSLMKCERQIDPSLAQFWNSDFCKKRYRVRGGCNGNVLKLLHAIPQSELHDRDIAGEEVFFFFVKKIFIVKLSWK